MTDKTIYNLPIFYHPQSSATTKKKEHYWGSADRGEGYHDSDINCMSSDNLWQYNTIPNQC